MQSRKGLCGGNPSLLGERANDRKALWYMRYGKCSGCAPTVRVPLSFIKGGKVPARQHLAKLHRLTALPVFLSSVTR